MKKVLMAVVLVLGLAVTGLASAQALWQQAQYGMTVEEVKAAFPNAEVSTASTTLKSGAKALLKIPAYEVVGKDFDVSFYFLEGKLVQVSLGLQKPGAYSTAMVTFRSLADALRARYGQELSMREQPSRVMSMAEAKWMSGKTNVTLVCMGVGYNDAVLNLVYQVSLVAEAGKL